MFNQHQKFNSKFSNSVHFNFITHNLIVTRRHSNHFSVGNISSKNYSKYSHPGMTINTISPSDNDLTIVLVQSQCIRRRLLGDKHSFQSHVCFWIFTSGKYSVTLQCAHPKLLNSFISMPIVK